MSDPRPSLDLSSLESDYEIVGELSAPHSARTLLATRRGGGRNRREDEPGVVISVVVPPEGDEGNALSHLAADAGLMRATPHRRLVPVLDSRWIGKEAYAVVTPRILDPSLAAMIAKGEKFTNPRIAAILREISGLLTWARDTKIVHRVVVPERVFIEPRTDRLRISFAVAPVYRLQHADDAAADGRTIARLAVAMLTGSLDDYVLEGMTLGELRPDLPAQLPPAATALLDAKRESTPDEVNAFIAMIGMADPLFAGESEAGRIRAEVLEEQRVEREKLANERAEFERMMASEREKLAAERAALESAVSTERDALKRAAEAERAALVARRAELEREATAQRAEVERVTAQDRQAIAALRAEIAHAGELEVEKKRVAALDEVDDGEIKLDTGRYATP
ncbi:MAG: hypothetical protein H0W68_09175, partial [Gemmatimonadaceae bacterium]|nr:hypothetical protein [Gemmatimonadaceae bacterium]